MIKLPGWLNFPLTWLFFFYTGILCKEYKIFIRKRFTIISILLVISSLLMDYKFVGINGDYNFPHLWNFISKVLLTFLAIMFFANFPRNHFFRYFEKYGKNSLIIYLVHVPVISATRVFVFYFCYPNVFIMIIILVGIGWYLSVFIVFVSKKIKIINMIFSPYRYVKF